MNECFGTPCKDGFAYLRLDRYGSFRWVKLSSSANISICVYVFMVSNCMRQIESPIFPDNKNGLTIKKYILFVALFLKRKIGNRKSSALRNWFPFAPTIYFNSSKKGE